MDYVLEADFKESSTVSNNWFLYFLGNEKKNIFIKIFSCSLFYRISLHFDLLISQFTLVLSSICSSLLFCSVNVMIISTFLVSAFKKSAEDLLEVKVYKTANC